MKTLPLVVTALCYYFSAHFVIAESHKWEIFNLKGRFELPDKTSNPASWLSHSYEIINAPEKYFDINQDLEQKWGDEAWYRFICISESKVTLSQDGFEDYIGSNKYKDCIAKNRNRDACNNNRFKAGFNTKVGSPPSPPRRRHYKVQKRDAYKLAECFWHLHF